MGCFAVVHEPDEPKFVVSSCHLNFWSLSGLFGRRIFLWDIGLTLEVLEDEGKELSKIGLLLPFGTDPRKYKDLSTEILEQNTARLLFGKSVNVNSSKSIIEFAGEPATDPLRVVRVINATIVEAFQNDERLRRANLSLWTIEVEPKIKKGHKAYVRIRFPMRNLGRTWVTMRSGKGVLIDIRVADIREIVIPTEGGAKLEAYGQRFVAIAKLRVFVIVPGSLIYRATSPTLHYMRLFEGRVWEKYLGGRAVDLWRSQKLMISMAKRHFD